MGRPHIFVSHSRADKPFARRLASDLGAIGARVWLDEAELEAEGSLLEKIERAGERVDHLAIVLSPASVGLPWVREELGPAAPGALGGRAFRVLPILLEDCEIPDLLRETPCADFRTAARYAAALQRLARSLGLTMKSPPGAEVRDPLAARFGRVRAYYARPSVWHCVHCGWRCDVDYNTYYCPQCKGIRPFFAPGATMRECRWCRQWNLALASYCEWCGESLFVSAPSDE